MRFFPKRLFACLGLGFLAVFSAWSRDPSPSIDEPAAPESPASTNGVTGETPSSQNETKAATSSEPRDTDREVSPEAEGSRKATPITPDLANLNLPNDLELLTLDTKEKVFLPAGTYRQILRIPIDSPTMQAAQKTRLERRPAVKVSDPLPAAPESEKKPLWIRYESLEKIKINEEERRGGLDVPINGPADLKVRLWYAKSETADTASSVFYFLFGGLGYSTANILGWSAGNTREIPGDFEYRLIRR